MINFSLEKIFKPIKKIRFVDYLIIAIILIFTVILFRFFNPEEKWINTIVFTQNVSIFQINSLNKGDFEKDPSGKKTAEILDIKVYDAYKTKNIVTDKDIFIKIKILVGINPKSKEYEYKNKIMKVGSPIEFIFNSAQIKGTLAEFEGVKQEGADEVKILTLKLYSQWPWFAESLIIGEGEKDEKGEKIIEIISKEVTPAEITAATANGDTLLRTDPRKVDVTLKVKAKIQRFEEMLVYQKEFRVAVGEQLIFNAGKSRVENAFITNLE